MVGGIQDGSKICSPDSARISCIMVVNSDIFLQKLDELVELIWSKYGIEKNFSSMNKLFISGELGLAPYEYKSLIILGSVFHKKAAKKGVI